MASTDNIIVACVILILSSIAFSTYVVASAAIYCVYRNTKNPFYLLLLAMGISDSTMLALFLLYSTPATFLQRPPLGSDFDALFCGVLCNITYFTSLALLVNIALNRYFTICSKDLVKRVYDKNKIKISIAGCFAFGIGSAAAQMTPCCSLRYYEKEYTWSYDLTLNGNGIFVWYDRSMAISTFLCLTICYILLFRKIRKKQKATQSTFAWSVASSKSDIRLAVQSALVAALQITFAMAFTIIPLFTSSKWWNFISSILYIGATGIHPFIYIGFNTEIRNQSIGFFGCLKGNALSLSRSVNAAPSDLTINSQKAKTGTAMPAKGRTIVGHQ